MSTQPLSTKSIETQRVSTFCRVCEPSCGLIAELEVKGEDKKILRILPDKAHPVTKGFACHKGIEYLSIHNDPDRVNFPLKRLNPRTEILGNFQRLSWDDAIDEIAEKIKHIQAGYGAGAFAAYIGNPTAFNSLLSQAMGTFLAQLGCQKIFSAATQDCSNKFAAGEAVYGTSTLHPIPDIERTDYLLILGENPKVSHMSFMSIADPMAKIRAARKRGAQVKFVNPRRIESVGLHTEDLIQIKPDTDLYFLAALINELKQQNLLDQDAIQQYGSQVDKLFEFTGRFSADTVADVVGVPAAEIKKIARDFGHATSASIHMSTGVNMGRQGTLCYWLVQMLSFVSGNLDKPGGNIYSTGFYPAAHAGRVKLENVYFDSPVGRLRTIRGSLPGNLLPDFIQSEHEPIKALFVFAGNPLLSIGGEARMRESFKSLELIVIIDLYRNATAELADYVLPAADMFERSDINICGLGMQLQPFVQYTDAVVDPRYDRKEEWWILASIERALGLPSILDQSSFDIQARNNNMLGKSGLSIDALKKMPSQTAVLGELSAGKFFTDWIQTTDRRIACYPAIFADALQQAFDIFIELSNEPSDTLKLINLRNNYMHNSWYQNIAKLKRGQQCSNDLYIHPLDAFARGFDNDERVTVSNQHGEINTCIQFDETLRPGVVAMTHGWGNANTPGMQVAHLLPGANVNQLLPQGLGSYERLSNQAHMTGIKVEICKIELPVDNLRIRNEF